MSLSHQGGRRCWRVLSQLRQSSSSSLPRPLTAHLSLQSFRLNGFPISSGSYLHLFDSSPSFSTAAEASHMANSADPEVIPTVDSASEKQGAASSSALESELYGEQEDTVLKKMLEEQRELVRSLRAELEDQKTLTRSILDEIRVLKLNVDAKAAESKTADKKQHCLEWTAFMEHLQSSDFFKDEDGEPSSDSGSIFEDPTCVKRAIYKFSRAHEPVFEYLSQIDLRIIARYGSTASDPKASAAQKRLCQLFHIEDPSSDTGAAKPPFIQPKLSDVTKLLYSTVLEGTYGDDVKPSISHLLREIVAVSKKPSAVSLPAAETTLSSKVSAALFTAASDMMGQSRQEKEKELKKEKNEVIQKVGIAKPEEAVKVTARAEARPENALQAPQWKCPRCSFMNLDTKHRCVECSRRRPQRTYGSDTAKSTVDVSLGEEDLDVKMPVEGMRVKKANERKDSSPSLSTQGRKNFKDSSLVIQEQDTTDVDVSSNEPDIGSDGSEAFSVLDDILDSEDLSDEQQEEGKISELLDDSEKEQQGNSKRASLATLFPENKPISSSRYGGQRGLKQRNGKKGGDRPSKSARLEDDDDNGGSRHGLVGQDSEDDDPPSHRSGRGFGFQGNDYSHKPGRGGFNSFRGRGGPRGSGGGRGDPFDSRRNEGSPRGSSAYGNRDGGERSSNYGSRPPRRRPKF